MGKKQTRTQTSDKRRTRNGFTYGWPVPKKKDAHKTKTEKAYHSKNRNLVGN